MMFSAVPPRLPALLALGAALWCLPTKAATTPNCTNASFRTPAWAVTEVSHHIEDASWTVTVTNIATNSSVEVDCQSSQCSPQLDPDTLVSVAKINESLGVTVKQNWTCNDRRWNDVPIVLNFTATGKTTVPAACNARTCSPDKSPVFVRGTLLAPLTGTPRSLDPPSPYALGEPLSVPFAGSCLTWHLQTTGWNIQHVGMRINYTDSVSGAKRDAATVSVGFQAHGGFLKAGRPNSMVVPLLEGTKNITDGSKWVDCYGPGQSTTAPCKFQFDSATRRLTIARITCCNDVDDLYPYQLTIKASFTVPSTDCAWRDHWPESERDTVVGCSWDADPPWNASQMTVESLSDITWEAMPAGWGKNIWDGARPLSYMGS